MTTAPEWLRILLPAALTALPGVEDDVSPALPSKLSRAPQQPRFRAPRLDRTEH